MIAILGGGITALAAAMELQKRGLDFILLEADERCGGKIYSKNKDGFLMEMGPNTVLINNPETETLFIGRNSHVFGIDKSGFYEQQQVR